MYDYTIYALVDPRDKSIRYVGRTAYNAQMRLKEHLKSPQGSREKILWIKELEDLGIRPMALTIEANIADPYEADEKETYWIQYYYSKGEPLTNIRKTGQGISYMLDSEETDSGEEEEWMPMAVAAKRLNVPAQKIAELAGRGTIRWEKDFLNQRVKLVEYHEVRKAFSLSRYYRDQMK